MQFVYLVNHKTNAESLRTQDFSTEINMDITSMMVQLYFEVVVKSDS